MINDRTVEIAKNSQSADGRRRDLEFFETNHIPSNKRAWEVHKCNARLAVADYDGTLAANRKPWTEITVEEYETYESGKSTTRSVTFYLHEDNRQALIDMLSRDPQPVG
jgi:hypothetical protein